MPSDRTDPLFNAGMDDDWEQTYNDAGYFYCPGCREHHRPPVGEPCPIDAADDHNPADAE